MGRQFVLEPFDRLPAPRPRGPRQSMARDAVAAAHDSPTGIIRLKDGDKKELARAYGAISQYLIRRKLKKEVGVRKDGPNVFVFIIARAYPPTDAPEEGGSNISFNPFTGT